jgi:hypothetical protein
MSKVIPCNHIGVQRVQSPTTGAKKNVRKMVDAALCRFYDEVKQQKNNPGKNPDDGKRIFK